MTAPAPDAPVDFATLGQVVHEEILRLRAEEQEIVHRESEIQTMLARRRWQELFGSPGERPADSSPAKAPSALDKPIEIKARGKQKPAAVHRAKLAKKVAEAWATNEGKEKLVGHSMRKLKLDYGVRSHSSFYDVPFFVKVIKPMRERLKLERQSANFLERNARSRP